MMFKKPLMAVLALALCTAATAADYLVVIPVKGRTAAVRDAGISVTLQPYTLPNAEMGTPYSFDIKTLLTVSGDPAYDASTVTWSVVSSSLPAGVALSPNGLLQGTPTADGQGAITVRAGYKSKSGEQTYQLVSVGLTVTLNTAPLPSLKTGMAYSYDFKQLLQVQGPQTYNSSDVAWTVAAGTLPAGLSLGANGMLSGTPTSTADAVPVTVKATYLTKSAQADYVFYQGDPYWAQTLALLHMDGTSGSTAFVDQKGGAYTAAGATVSAVGKFQQSGYFPGGSGKGVIGPAINLPADFTVEAWVNPNADGLTGFRTIAGQWSQQSPSVGAYLLGLSNGHVGFYFGPYSVMTTLLSGASVTANTWSHVAVTRQGSTFRLFLNGALVASATSTAPGLTIPVSFAMGDYFGSSGTFGAGGAASFSGYIDEVRVTTVSRYNAPFTPPTSPSPSR